MAKDIHQSQFAGLFEPKLLEEIEAVSVYQKKKAGTEMIQMGEEIRNMPLIVKGVVKISRLDEEGRELLLYYVNAHESCAMTFTCCMQGKISEIHAVAEEDVEFFSVPIKFMDIWMGKYPSWKAFVMRTIQARFEELLQTIDQVAFQKLDDRLVKYLAEKSKVTGSSLLNLSHEQVARELGSSRVVVSRLLKKLENSEKLLLYRNQIKILAPFES